MKLNSSMDPTLVLTTLNLKTARWAYIHSPTSERDTPWLTLLMVDSNAKIGVRLLVLSFSTKAQEIASDSR